ncbi:PREDICTED: olfactory receptor 9K2-like [Tauraco erythrolophus]|uniref:olfactory receptor 9K2-like n=1 Tax=Tauraco erythrolophus TaxID=121530 RepID=UPI0005230F98|nr:PREDICTED: olfactory receptor 9K2-like [Tauraco erythrolophus]
MMPFCNANRFDRFFCDSVLLIKLSWAETQIFELITFIPLSIILLDTVNVTAVSYLYIINTILSLFSIPSQHKTFSTCSSHFIIVILVYLVTTLMCPLIFSPRNQLMEDALKAGLKRRLMIFKKQFLT